MWTRQHLPRASLIDLSELSSTLIGLESSKVQDKVIIPGDPERAHMEKCDKLGGIEYHPNQIDFANELARKLAISPVKLVGDKEQA